MRAVMVEVPPELLEERRQRGVDRWDEMWEGVLHMVPPASGKHQRFGTGMLLAFTPLAQARGLVAQYETGLFRSADDYRVPDLMFARPDQCSDRGVDGSAVFVVEIRSPGDETYAKLDWYGALGVTEMLVVDPESRRFEVFASRDGRVVLVQADETGAVRLQTLGATLLHVEGSDGPRLRISGDGCSAEI